MKYNPFRPGSIVVPGMFVGRSNEINEMERCLFQTKHENPQHFLILGERGIGKSSLLLYMDMFASGQFSADDDLAKFDFITVSADLGGCRSQLDIIQSIGRSLKRAVGKRKAVISKASQFWNWLSKWEVLGVRFHETAENLDPDQISSEFVDQISTLCKQCPEIDGIVILIDEADRPEEEAQLGAFLKFFTERLTRSNCNKVVLGVAGLPLLLPKLRASHDSSPRLFHIFHLKPLEFKERIRVVKQGVNEANEKNSWVTSIDDDALEAIADLSEGYPHFVQQFAYSAFDIDTDNNITTEDVMNGAYGENGALQQLGDKYFHEMYNARISSGDYRRVLDAMAEHGDDWIRKRDIVQESGVSETTVTNALSSLKGKQIIFTEEGKPGYYRLPTRSFAAWIKAIKNDFTKKVI